jgi:hypothetical protein
MQWAQYNTGATAGASTMRVGVGVVFTESADVLYSGSLMHITPPNPIKVASADNYQPFLQFKAKSTVNGLPNTIIGIHETFDWSTQGNVNLHVGIFVIPSDEYLLGTQWSETIQPATMLYVDQNSYSMPQYEFWGTTGNVVGSISSGLTINYEGNATTYSGNLTVTAATSPLLPEMYLSTNRFVSGSAFTTGSVADKTRVIKQLTATGTATAVKTVSAGGTSGTRWFTANSSTNLYNGQIVSGTGIPLGTFVEKVSGANVLLTQNFTTGSSGNYNFSNIGGTGVYQVNKSQTVSSSTIYGFYRVQPVESFIAPANSAGRAALGDRIEKSFGLGGNPDAAEESKAVFIFGVKALGTVYSGQEPTLMYTKYWKEIR